MTRISLRRRATVPLIMVWGALTGCHEVAPTLERACLDDPLGRECRTAGCSTSYECVSYCLERFPDLPDGPAPPASGPGSWCGEVAGEYAAICLAAPHTSGCSDWCGRHPDSCGAADADADIDGDGDGEGDADADGDGDSEGGCVGHDDCAEAASAQCLDGRCVPCAADPHCDGVTDRSICRDGACVQCREDALTCPFDRPLCDTVFWVCVACAAHDQCTDPERARCDWVTFECAPCERNRECDGIAGLPVCHDGRCVQCTEELDGACAEGASCDPLTNLCLGCADHDDCVAPEAARCSDEGGCVPCSDEAHCAGVAGRQVCDDGLCVECTEGDVGRCPAGAPRCLADEGRCVPCLDHGDCSEPARARCDEAHRCVPCDDDGHCAGVVGRPVCQGGSCVTCTADDERACGEPTPRCLEPAHRCVECLDADDCRSGDPACARGACRADNTCEYDADLDDDGASCDDDCDDEDPDRSPGALERCDGLDNDCDGDAERDWAVAIDDLRVSARGADEVWHADLSSSDDVHLIVWCRGNRAEHRGDPRAAIVDRGGATIWAGDLANPSGQCSDVAVQWTGTAFIVLWGTAEAIRAATLSEGGELLREPFILAREGALWLDIDRWEVIQNRLVWTSAETGRVFIRAFRDDLTSLWDDREVEHCNHWAPPHVAVHRAAAAVICSEASPGRSTTVWAQAFQQLGPAHDPVRLAHLESDHAVMPAGIAGFADHFVVAWYSTEDDTLQTQSIELISGRLLGIPRRFLDAAALGVNDLHFASVGRADERGGSPGFVAATLGTNARGDHLVTVARGAADGRRLDELLAPTRLRGEVGDTEVLLHQGESPSGSALVVADRVDGDWQLRLTTLETCF